MKDSTRGGWGDLVTQKNNYLNSFKERYSGKGFGFIKGGGVSKKGELVLFQVTQNSKFLCYAESMSCPLESLEGRHLGVEKDSKKQLIIEEKIYV